MSYQGKGVLLGGSGGFSAQSLKAEALFPPESRNISPVRSHRTELLLSSTSCYVLTEALEGK